MSYNIMNIFIILALFLAIHSCGQKRDAAVTHRNLHGDDYLLFMDSPIWPLARAVEEEDVDEIRRLVKDAGLDVNYQEAKFGNSLLLLSVLNQQAVSCEALLKVGANPNLHNKYSGSTALIEAAKISNKDGDNSEFLHLLLRYGADPNEVETGARQPDNTIRWSPLLAACSDVTPGVSPMNKVKALIEAGADIDYIDEFNHFPLREALIYKHYDVTVYLLEHGANFKRILFDRGKFQANGKKIYIADILREHMFPLGSKKHKLKMKIVDFLQKNGVDYSSVLIPDFVVKRAKQEYPDEWQDYLEKY